MPVTTSVISIESWSICNPQSICRLPAGIHWAYVRTNGASSRTPCIDAKMATARPNADSMTPVATIDTSVCCRVCAAAAADSRASTSPVRPGSDSRGSSDRSPLTTAPSRGSSGNNQAHSATVPANGCSAAPAACRSVSIVIRRGAVEARRDPPIQSGGRPRSRWPTQPPPRQRQWSSP